MAIFPHTQHILIVEDERQVALSMKSALEKKHYLVHVADTVEQAVIALQTYHYHVALIDLYLTPNDHDTASGLEVFDFIHAVKLDSVMDTIALSDVDKAADTLAVLGDYNAVYFIVKKGTYLQALIQRVNILFRRTPAIGLQQTMLGKSRLKIKFNLIYQDRTAEAIQQVVRRVRWKANETRPLPGRLVPQVYELLGKLFRDSDKLNISMLTPGDTGASILKITSTKNNVLAYPTIVKIGRRYKIEREVVHYDAARDFFSGLIQQFDKAYTSDLGAILYKFASDNGSAKVEFQDYVLSHSDDEAAECLKKIFERFERSFKNRQPDNASLPALYYEAFDLKDDERPEVTPEEYLCEKIRDPVPDFDPNSPTFQLPGSPVNLLNPIHWLRTHPDIYDIEVFKAYTHGDLTTRNVMVGEDGVPHMIDFYRTYPSHILRDFVIMETDLKYRLLKTNSMKTFIRLEQALLSMEHYNCPEDFLPDQKKLYKLLYTLRSIAKKPTLYCSVSEFTTGMLSSTHEEFLVSLLMATLNITRFPVANYPLVQKRQAMLSAAMITDQLRKLRRANRS